MPRVLGSGPPKLTTEICCVRKKLHNRLPRLDLGTGIARTQSRDSSGTNKLEEISGGQDGQVA